MVVLLMIGILLLAIILWILLSPITIYADSDEKQFFIHFKGLFKANFREISGKPFLQVKSLGWHKNIDLIQSLSKRKPQKGKVEKRPAPQTKKTSKSKRFVTILRFLRESLLTFKVKRFVLDLDLDDYVINAQLYPLFLWMSSDRVQLSTNYDQRLYLHFLIENQLVRMIPPLWRFVINK